MKTTIISTEFGFGIFDSSLIEQGFSTQEIPALFYAEDKGYAQILRKKVEEGEFDEILSDLEDRNDYPSTQNERPLYELAFNNKTKNVEVRYFDRWYWSNYNVIEVIEL